MPPRDAPAAWFHRLCLSSAVAVPFAAAVARAASGSQWREDLPVVRGIGLIGAAGTGALSTVLIQLSSLLPFGPRLFRAALVAAIALGACSALLYLLARRVLLANVATPRLAPVLALIAALTTTLSPTWQREGTVAAGATVAVLAALAALLVRAASSIRDARIWLGMGALVGATLAESAVTGLAVLAAIALQTVALREIPTRRSVGLFLSSGASTGAMLLMPLAVRPLAPRTWVDLGRALGTLGLATADVALPRPTAIGAWASEVGVVALGLSAFGAAIAVLRGRLRWFVAPLLLLVLADAVFPQATAGVLSGDPFAPLRALAIASVAIAAAVGVQTAATMLLSTGVPTARAAAILLVMFDLTLVAIASEGAAFGADRSAALGADTWTEEAFERLPPRSAVLVRSRAVAWRLWAARLVEGARPDVLVVPLPLLGRGRVASGLLSAEPALAGLLRDVSMDGKPGENAMTTLADARPLEVEVDPGWDKRLVSHLVVDRLWLRFAPEPLGSSDRKVSFLESRAPFARVVAAARTEDKSVDPATAAVLAAHLRDQAAASAMLGEREATLQAMDVLGTVSVGDPFVAELTQRLAATRAGSVDVKGLLK